MSNNETIRKRAKRKKFEARAKHYDRKSERKRKKSLGAKSRAFRRSVVLKVCACVIALCVFAFMAIMVGDSEYHATAIGWVPFVMVIFGIVFAYAYVYALSRSISYTESPASLDCERGDDIRFDVNFKNSGPLFFFRVEAYFYISDLFDNVATENMTTLGLGPREKTNVGFDTTFDHIGTYSAGLNRLVIHDFLGLFQRTLPNNYKRVINVTPKLVCLEDLRLSWDSMQESTKAKKSVITDSMDYSHVREYEQGDPLKTIHWNLSARVGSFMTRLYEMPTNPSVCVIMDFYSMADHAQDLMSAFDAVVESSFSIAQFTRTRGMDTEVIFRDKNDMPYNVVRWGKDELPKIIDSMPKMTNDAQRMQGAISLLREQISLTTGANNIIVCSANLDAQLIDTVVEAKIRRRSPLMVAVVPSSLDGRARDKYCKNLSRLDAADIPYLVISRAEDLVKES